MYHSALRNSDERSLVGARRYILFSYYLQESILIISGPAKGASPVFRGLRPTRAAQKNVNIIIHCRSIVGIDIYPYATSIRPLFRIVY